MADMNSGVINQRTTYAQGTPPSNNSESVIWVDTSDDPNNPKVYDNSTGAWIPVNTTGVIVSQTEPEVQPGHIWFEPVSGGSNMYAASEYGWGFIQFIADIADSALTKYLEAWYFFEDGDARDYTNDLDVTFADTNGYDGSITGATYQNTGGVVKPLSSDAGYFSFTTSDYIDISSFPARNQNITYMAWIRPDTIHSAYAITMRDGAYTEFGTDNDGTFLFKAGDNSYVNNAGSYSAGNWYHLAIAADEYGHSLYVDGSQKLTSNNVGSRDSGGSNQIGGGGVSGYDGDIDDFRIYNRKLTSAEISAIYSETQP